jgi:cytidylate kinase
MAKIASKISMMPETRKNLISIQRSFKNDNGLIADGRDMGTVVFPEAAYKIFLTADPETRAKRRFLELQKKGQEVNMRDLIKDIEARDKADTERSLSPLIPASDASIIDTSILNPDQVLSRAIELVC